VVSCANNGEPIPTTAAANMNNSLILHPPL
jgi:hypothetical protein